MFEGFEEFDMPTSQTAIHGVRGRSGPPVLLLHGIPETHLMWHRVAPAQADRGQRRIECPTLVLWSATGAVGRWYDPLDVWKVWATDVRGVPVGAGHFLPEEAPEDTLRHLLALLT